MFLKNLGVNPNLVHAIGHSLGAHVVGHFGRTIQSEGYEKIIRMTGNSSYNILTQHTFYQVEKDGLFIMKCFVKLLF